MNISNVNVYGLTTSVVASGYPMKTDLCEEDLIKQYFDSHDKHFKRAINLGTVKTGTGHDNYLKGVIVQFDLKAPEYFWRQFDRYNFHDYVSSQSKMHNILKFDIESQCNKYVDSRIVNVVKELKSEYNNNPTKENFQRIISNVPMGFELTARITSNYLQEKTIYFQRKNHKLEEWTYYTDWLRQLPNFLELISKEEYVKVPDNFWT
jgi:hypothetical protein